MACRVVLLLLSLMLGATTTPVLAQDRHALVVGIDAYDNLPSLEKAVNDGRSMAASLERAGFTVDAGFDLDRRGFVQLLSQFLNRLEPEDEALVFYAGHAVAIGNANYIVPSDASALEQSSEALIIAESIGQEFMLEQITATGVRLTVVIMDACRNNPFEGLSTRSLGRNAGLAVTQPPRGVFMMFSADEGQTALDRLSNDDPNPNSVFTRTLLPLIEEPGLDIVDIARRLRGDVQELAASVQHQQFPVYRDRMQGDGQFIVRPAVAVGPEQPAPVAEPLPAVIARPPADPCADARADWSLVGDSPSAAILEAYLSAHGDCPLMATLASERLAALAAAPPTTPEPVAATPVPSTPSPRGAVSQLVEACVSVAHPDHVTWTELEATAALSTADQACTAALEALQDQTSTEYFHVMALLGRVEHRSGNFTAAHELYRVAADARDPVAANNFASLYEYGEGVAVNGDHAARWYRRAGEFGSSTGWYSHGLLYLQGELVPQDYDIAVESLMRAADMGYDRAMNRLARMYRDGEGLVQSNQLASDWFLRAAEAGHLNSMVQIGFMYNFGRGIGQDYAEAARWYQMASDLGSAIGTARLGILYLNGNGVPRDPEGAYILFNQAADEGNLTAMRFLGYMLRDGDDIPQDERAAADWFRMAAEGGDASSAGHLAHMYFRGTGVEQSNVEAYMLYLQGAEGGDGNSMRNLGIFLRDGIAGRRDNTEALRWFTAAADAGDPFANYFVGWQYQYGRGVPINMPEAARWFMRGLAAGDNYAIRNPDEFQGEIGREVQTLLRQEGHYTGPIDGAVGAGTIAAMQSYMDAN